MLAVEPRKLRRWLNGGRVSGKGMYPPVIRPTPSTDSVVTWAEFVEAGFLREYRQLDIPLQRMRRFIDAMRERFKVQYPLAHFRPLVDTSARDLLPSLQESASLGEPFSLVRWLDDQLVFSEAVKSFLAKVEFDPDGVALRMHPLGRDRSPVTVDPEVSFGAPQIRGYRTESIAEDWATQDEPRLEAFSAEWGLSEDEVLAAVQWELRTKAA
jgi:uncharacterized protein (DUF433 family)